MKKIVLVIMLVALMFTGCTNNAAANTPANVDKPGEVKTQEKKEMNLSFFQSSGTFANCPTEDGYYYISDNDHGDGITINLMYLDYKSRKEMYLCNQPGCTHNTDSCNSLLADISIGDTPILFISKNRLFLLVSPQDSSGSLITGWSDPDSGISISSSSNIQPKLYSMNLDGTDRRMVSEFDSGIVLENTAAVSGNDIYVICKKIKSESIGDNSTYQSAYDRQLVHIDASTGKQEKVCDLEAQDNSRLIGAFGSKLVFQATRFARQLTPEEIFNDETYKQELKKAKTIVSVLDVDTCEDSQVFEISGDKTFTSQVSGSKLYYSIKEENQIKSLDLDLGTEEVIAGTPNSNIDWVYNESMRIRSWDNDDNRYYTLNLSSGEIRETGLYTGELHNPVDILAENSEYFLVIYDYECSGEYTTWAGTTQNDIISNKLGLISKEDYFKGNPSYEPIEVIGDGR